MIDTLVPRPFRRGRLLDLLPDLLPLRQAYAARGLQPPAQLLDAIDRMMPMLRLFRHDAGHRSPQRPLSKGNPKRSLLREPTIF
jgi:hypothetical protein